jgi:IS605 OrfB family transposase
MVDDELYVEFFFEKEKPGLRNKGEVVGLDLGYAKLASLSDGQQVGTGMNRFIENFDRREKNTYVQVKQRVFEELKKIDFSDVRLLVLEKLRDVKKDKRGMFPRGFNRRLSHWLYAETAQWLGNYCEEHGIRIFFVSPWKTPPVLPAVRQMG